MKNPRRNGLFSIGDGFCGSGRLGGGVRSHMRTGLPCYLANIRVIFENNSEPAAKSVKKTCGTGISLILRQFHIREEQGAAHCRYTEAALSEQRSGKKRIRIGWSRLVRPRRGIRLAIGQGETGSIDRRRQRDEFADSGSKSRNSFCCRMSAINVGFRGQSGQVAPLTPWSQFDPNRTSPTAEDICSWLSVSQFGSQRTFPA
jgi:hypothetical protein